MLPEIETIATKCDYILLIELAKSASTKNLISSIFKNGDDVESKLRSFVEKRKDAALKRRICQALMRFEKELRRLQISR
jgi:hypothetical protein